MNVNSSPHPLPHPNPLNFTIPSPPNLNPLNYSPMSPWSPVILGHHLPNPNYIPNPNTTIPMYLNPKPLYDPPLYYPQPHF